MEIPSPENRVAGTSVFANDLAESGGRYQKRFANATQRRL
jgi:hypothetical protein